MNPLVAAFVLATPSVQPSLLGYSGLLNVPSADIRRDLGIAFRWIDAPRALLEPAGIKGPNRSYILSAPFLPFLEGSLDFLQVVGWYDPEATVTGYAVHRAFSAKAAVSPFPGSSLAAGVVDPISANFLNKGGRGGTHYGLTAVYGVATQRLGPLALTVGYGMGDETPGRDSRTQPFLDGPFGGAQWALAFGLELLAEWDGLDFNYGARWNGPWGIGLEAGRVGGGLSGGLSLGVPL